MPLASVQIAGPQMPRKPTQREWRAWERRARTTLERAHQLSCDIMEVVGVDSSESDFTDAVVDQCEILVDVLYRQQLARGRLK